MARNRRTQSEDAASARKQFLAGLADVIGSNTKKLAEDSPWQERPVSLKTFCSDFIGEPLFTEQYRLGVKIFGTKATEFSEDFFEFHAFWGKGSGKDLTVAKLQAYLIYKLMCLKNPQRFLREQYGCSIGDGDAIDIANMSVNARQAQNVFFKKFKSVIKRVTDPETGENWFAARGVDLRDGYDLQTVEANFPKSITAHSLNSETNIGEGLNPILVTIDEYGGFRVDNAQALKESVESSIKSRFKRIGKLLVLSFMYNPYDPMAILYRKGIDNPDVFSSRKASWEVNELLTQEDFAKEYRQNPERARMKFECIAAETGTGYVAKPYMLDRMFSAEYENPVVGDLLTIDSDKIMQLQFKDFFKPDPNLYYVVHCDLATGSDKHDCAALAMGHIKGMVPKIDPRLARDIAKTGVLVEDVQGGGFETVRKGVVLDLLLQFTNQNEIILADIRRFIIEYLKKRLGFNIILVTFDGWQSKDSIQILQAAGIDSYVHSVDRNNNAYDTWKSLMYQQLVKTYPHDIAKREAKELQITTSGKVDHPEKSYERLAEEGREEGSKDIMDCVVAVVDKVTEMFSLDADVFFG